MNVFINSIEAISPQNTFDTNEFLPEIKKSDNQYLSCITPNYKEYINPRLLRRMSPIVRMGIACSIKVLQTANIEQPDAIIIGTGLGCIADTVKFLDQIIENNESLLNPTAFIQSTHNTVSGQIALFLTCKKYNFTFSQQTVSFETALIDAFMMLQEEAAKNILLGALDEITERSYSLLKQADCTKDSTSNIYKAQSKGYIPGEGANFFVLSNEKSDKNIAQIKAVSAFNKIDDKNELPTELKNIFAQHNLSIQDIDVLISGINGDVRTDKNYAQVQQVFKNSTHIAYKHLVGEYDTASGFATWLGTKLIQTQLVPDSVKINNVRKELITNILIHHYDSDHGHSFILLSKC